MSFKVLFLSLSTFFLTVGFSQEAPLSLEKGTLNEQFDYIVQKSNTYEDFKVVKADWIAVLKAHVADSIQQVKEELKTLKQGNSSHQADLDAVKEQLVVTKAELDTLSLEKDNMSFFGMLISKPAYNTSLAFFFSVLLVLLLVFMYKFKTSNAITQQAQKSLADLESEFEEHKQRALEREHKVMRQLQDELNKKKKPTK